MDTPWAQRFTLVSADPSNRRSAFARDVRQGLTAVPRHLSCCYFYDRDGSRLFEAVCELPDYSRPGGERATLQSHAAEGAGRFPGGVKMVELGSGNAAKTRLLIEALLTRQQTLRYVPVDICRTVLEE